MSRFGTRTRGTQPVSAWLSGGGARIRSIQRGVISIAAGATSNTATITSVVLSNSVLKFVGYVGNGAATTPDIVMCRLAFTNATTLTASVAVTGADTRIVSYEVIEYFSGVIKSVQRGTITTTGATSNTATISTVDTNKAQLDYLGFTTDHNGGTDVGFCGCRLSLTNATTVTATGVGAINRTIGFQVVEWL